MPKVCINPDQPARETDFYTNVVRNIPTTIRKSDFAPVGGELTESEFETVLSNQIQKNATKAITDRGGNVFQYVGETLVGARRDLTNVEAVITQRLAEAVLVMGPKTGLTATQRNSKNALLKIFQQQVRSQAGQSLSPVIRGNARKHIKYQLLDATTQDALDAGLIDRDEAAKLIGLVQKAAKNLDEFINKSKYGVQPDDPAGNPYTLSGRLADFHKRVNERRLVGTLADIAGAFRDSKEAGDLLEVDQVLKFYRDRSKTINGVNKAQLDERLAAVRGLKNLQKDINDRIEQFSDKIPAFKNTKVDVYFDRDGQFQFIPDGITDEKQYIKWLDDFQKNVTAPLDKQIKKLDDANFSQAKNIELSFENSEVLKNDALVELELQKLNLKLLEDQKQITKKAAKDKLSKLEARNKTTSKLLGMKNSLLLSAIPTFIRANVPPQFERLTGKQLYRISAGFDEIIAKWTEWSGRDMPIPSSHNISPEIKRANREVVEAHFGKVPDADPGQVFKRFIKEKGRVPADTSYSDIERGEWTGKASFLNYTNAGYLAVGAFDRQLRNKASIDMLEQLTMNELRLRGLTAKQAQEAAPNEMIRKYQNLSNAERHQIAQAADDAVYARSNKPARAINKFKADKLREGGTLNTTMAVSVDFAAPYIKTPVNLAKRTVNLTPGAGMLYDLHRYNRGQLSKVKEVNKYAARIDFARNRAWQYTAAGMAAAGFFMDRFDLISGGHPDDPVERDHWEETNRTAYSIRLPFTDSWFSIRFLGPPLAPLWTGKFISDSLDEGIEKDEFGDFLAAVAIEPLKLAVEETPGLQVVEAAMNSALGRGSRDRTLDNLGNIISSWPTQLQPGIVRALAQTTDNKKREIIYDDFWRQTYTRFVAGIPGFRHTLEVESGDLTGRDVDRTGGGDLRGAFKTFFFGSLIATERNGEDPVLTELRTLYDKGFKVAPKGAASLEYDMDPVEVMRINDQLQEDTYADWKRTIEGDYYQGLTDQQKKDLLDSVSRGNKDAAWLPHLDKRKDWDPSAPRPSVKREMLAAEKDWPFVLSVNDMTPSQKIDYTLERMAAGELGGKNDADYIKAEFDLRQFEVQKGWHDRPGGRFIYESYHSGLTKNEWQVWLERNFDSADEVVGFIAQLAAYENELIEAGARTSRSWTNKDGSPKSISEKFGDDDDGSQRSGGASVGRRIFGRRRL